MHFVWIPLPDTDIILSIEWHADNLFVFARDSATLSTMISDLVFELQIPNSDPKPSSLEYITFGATSRRLPEDLSIPTIYGDLLWKYTSILNFRGTSVNAAVDS